VVWCLFPDENLNNDGKHISYLRNPEFAKLDSYLYTALATIISEDRRSVSAICEYACLPSSTVFFSDPISTSEGTRTGPKRRIRYREAWFEACLRQIKECELVFFDPDNGLEVRSIPKHHPRAGKYIYWDELAAVWRRGKNLLVYHHLNRRVSAAQQIEMLVLQFASKFDRARIVPLVFRRGSSRAFWLIHHADRLGLELEQRAADLLSGAWSLHFRPWGWPASI
jgi:hypothetical protein